MGNSIFVRHNIEIAHRLYEMPGKCQQIHGHGMQVKMEIWGDLDEHGVLGSIEFGWLKKQFRTYLDEVWDHHLHLNAADPFARPIWTAYVLEPGLHGRVALEKNQTFLPGMVAWEGGDPTTENIAKWIGKHMRDLLVDEHSKLGTYDNVIPPITNLCITVDETCTNGATYQVGL